MREDVTMTPEKLLAVFFSSAPIKEYARGTTIISQNEDPACVFYLETGLVKQYARRQNGDELNVHIYRPGSVVPLMWLFNDTSNKYEYQALVDSSLHCVGRDDFLNFVNKHPALHEYFVYRLLLGLNGLLSRMESLVLDDAMTKTVLLFLYFAKTFGRKDEGGTLVDIPLTHKQVASWIGTARETASLTVEELRREGLLVYRRSRYVIPDVTALERSVSALKQVPALPRLLR